MTSVLILPGIGGSGPAHWQSLWEAAEPSFRRAEMPDWDRPELDVWLSALNEAVEVAPGPVVIAAHSLGCLAVAHFAARGGRVKAALLVAVPDPDGPAFPAEARSFAPVPLGLLGFPSRIVTSENDPYGGVDFAARCAGAWGSELTNVGRAGHINAQSELADWPAGRKLLASLLV
jgi:uncharacterized protein